MSRVFAFLAAGVFLSSALSISAQTTSSSATPQTTTTPTTNKPAAAAKPAAPVKPATATAPATTTKQVKPALTTMQAKPAIVTTPVKPVAAVAPATSGGSTAAQVVKQAATWQPYASTQPASGAAPARAGSTGSAPVTPGNSANSTGSRAPVGGLGVGSFVWPGGWTLTSYGCFRTDTRLFCDFDTTNPNNQQVNSSIWSGAGGVNLVDDGGKITTRHNAFFVGTDGTPFQTAYISSQPVRFVIEYDDVNASYSTFSLVLTNKRIQQVPVTQIDPNQPSGTIPARSAR